MPFSAEPFVACGRVLIADDEPIVASSAAAIMEDFGFDVLTVADGRLAVDAFEKEQESFKLVILDVSMPHMSGLEVCRHIQRLRPGTPVILSSGYREQDVANEFKNAPSVFFISKPYRITQLEDLLRTALSSDALK